jgi:hypothetical protein
MVSVKKSEVISSAIKVFWLFYVLAGSPVLGLRYDYGDGTYYVGNVDNDGRPNGRGQFYNSSGALGETTFRFSTLG